MDHCVGAYDDLCHRGLTRVFSVRDSIERRIATVALIWQDGYWQLEQMKGPSNAEVIFDTVESYEYEFMSGSFELSEIYFVGQEILTQYRTAWSERIENHTG